MKHIVHLGLGGFFRAHQAWYTGAAPDFLDWGITAFTGRSPALAVALSRQECRYDLVVRGPFDDRVETQTAIKAALPGGDIDTWCSWVARPDVAVLTLTVTEAAYVQHPAVYADVEALRGQVSDLQALRLFHPGAPALGTVPGRLVAGLAARRAAGAGPLAVVPCDNLPDNGPVTARMVCDLAARLDPTLADWITGNVSFVTTMVDRITPRSPDPGTVITEPYTEWILSGDFPAGRPTWEEPGARFVSDVKPHETRKLLLLNGAHTLLAYAGSARGHPTVAAAVADPECRRWLERWWDEASRHVPLPAAELTAYRAALLDRFANPRIQHTLAQIAADGTQKIPIRVLPVLRAERAAGRMPSAALHILTAWTAHLRGVGAPVNDAAAGPYRRRAGSARDVLTLLAPDLATDEDLLEALP